MSTHIGAEAGAIAPHVLMPGDPLRAKWIAETFLEDATCYNEVRGMLGYTGTWQGQRVSVQGSGMGQPSFAIYANELFNDYDVQSVVRVVKSGLIASNGQISTHLLQLMQVFSTFRSLTRNRLPIEKTAPLGQTYLHQNRGFRKPSASTAKNSAMETK